MRSKCLVLFAFALSHWGTPNAFASDKFKIKSSLEVADYIPSVSGSSLFLGGQISRNIFSDNFYFGGELSYARVHSDVSNLVFGFGGLLTYEKMQNTFIYGGDLGIGATHITQYSQATGLNVYLKPEIFGGVLLGNGWRLDVALFYQDILSVNPFSGLGFGLKFDFKFETMISPVNN